MKPSTRALQGIFEIGSKYDRTFFEDWYHVTHSDESMVLREYLLKGNDNIYWILKMSTLGQNEYNSCFLWILYPNESEIPSTCSFHTEFSVYVSR